MKRAKQKKKGALLQFIDGLRLETIVGPKRNFPRSSSILDYSIYAIHSREIAKKLRRSKDYSVLDFSSETLKDAL